MTATLNRTLGSKPGSKMPSYFNLFRRTGALRISGTGAHFYYRLSNTNDLKTTPHSLELIHALHDFQVEGSIVLLYSIGYLLLDKPGAMTLSNLWKQLNTCSHVLPILKQGGLLPESSSSGSNGLRITYSDCLKTHGNTVECLYNLLVSHPRIYKITLPWLHHKSTHDSQPGRPTQTLRRHQDVEILENVEQNKPNIRKSARPLSAVPLESSSKRDVSSLENLTTRNSMSSDSPRSLSLTPVIRNHGDALVEFSTDVSVLRCIFRAFSKSALLVNQCLDSNSSSLSMSLCTCDVRNLSSCLDKPTHSYMALRGHSSLATFAIRNLYNFFVFKCESNTSHNCWTSYPDNNVMCTHMWPIGNLPGIRFRSKHYLLNWPPDQFSDSTSISSPALSFEKLRRAITVKSNNPKTHTNIDPLDVPWLWLLSPLENSHPWQSRFLILDVIKRMLLGVAEESTALILSQAIGTAMCLGLSSKARLLFNKCNIDLQDLCLKFGSF